MSQTGRCCRKKILRGSSSNIDSRRASNAQDRFKNPACAILLLRVVRVAPTFSTASARLRHAVMSAPCRLSGVNRTRVHERLHVLRGDRSDLELAKDGNDMTKDPTMIGLERARLFRSPLLLQQQ